MSEIRGALARLLQALPGWQDPDTREALRRRLSAPLAADVAARLPTIADDPPGTAAEALAACAADGPALAALLDGVAALLATATATAGPPPSVWPLAASWADGQQSSAALAARVRLEALAWARQGCPPGGLWPDELLRPARRLLARGALLPELERIAVVADFLTPESERLLAELACHRTDDGRREEIGLRLAALGDPRPGILPVGGCPRPAWRAIPGGSVLIDGRRELAVAPFRLAAYPVTQAQFDVFLTADDGYGNPAWWHGLKRRAAPEHRGARRGNHPVTGISWYDARAFCRWLSARLGEPVRLPDEAEWQWAAQSARPDFLYPWGADWLTGRANTDEAGLGRTLAVGMYPAGFSLQGVADLAGNIWEWCRSSFEPGAAARGGRVIRGGSWRVNRGFARADFRLDASPDDRVGSTGFRVAAEPA